MVVFELFFEGERGEWDYWRVIRVAEQCERDDGLWDGDEGEDQRADTYHKESRWSTAENAAGCGEVAFKAAGYGILDCLRRVTHWDSQLGTHSRLKKKLTS